MENNKKDYIETTRAEYSNTPNEKKNGCYKFPNGSKSYWVNGKLHREDGPAIEYITGTKEYYLNGIEFSEEEFNKKMKKDYIEITSAEFSKIPKEKKTGCYKLENGNKLYFVNGKLHREDGPALERLEGVKEYYLNGKLHREDGPAIEYVNGEKLYWINGNIHREDGPAIEHANGTKEYYLNGIEFSKEDFNKAILISKHDKKSLNKIKETCDNFTTFLKRNYFEFDDAEEVKRVIHNCSIIIKPSEEVSTYGFLIYFYREDSPRGIRWDTIEDVDCLWPYLQGKSFAIETESIEKFCEEVDKRISEAYTDIEILKNKKFEGFIRNKAIQELENLKRLI